ncbi:MAG: urease subunit beta [Muribaculaceae bacterium]|nr:urease subunit beta [Muribaculaceae bacterium]
MSTDTTNTQATTPTQPAAEPQSYATPHGIYPGTPYIAQPKEPGFQPTTPVPVGGVILESGSLEYNVDRRTVKLTVRNTGDRPIQIGSHFHFFEVNRYMEFDREAAFGMHLNIPATTAVRFEPGEEKVVELVTYAGKQRIIGFNDLTQGFAGREDSPSYYPKEIRAFKLMNELGFKNVSEAEAEAEFDSTPAAKPASSAK